jgi:hypothetical protein
MSVIHVMFHRLPIGGVLGSRPFKGCQIVSDTSNNSQGTENESVWNQGVVYESACSTKIVTKKQKRQTSVL